MLQIKAHKPPAISPDGTRVAFMRDHQARHVFVLDIASGRIRRLTGEFWADRDAEKIQARGFGKNVAKIANR
jgi:hypothetical protein